MTVSRRILPWRWLPLATAIFALAIASLFAARAQAMNVSPVYLDMVSAGPGSRADIRVVNTTARPLPVEAVVSRVTYDSQGNEVVTRDDADFLVLPMQAMIPPGGSQILKVQWLGEPLIEESRGYRISVNQVPVSQPGAAKAVQVVMNLVVIVTVAPPQGQPALELVKSGTSRVSGKRIPTVTVRNPSKVHARLPHATIRLSGGAWSRVLPPDALRGLIGIGAVMPGQTRTFRIPVTLPEEIGTVRAELEYSPPGRR